MAELGRWAVDPSVRCPGLSRQILLRGLALSYARPGLSHTIGGIGSRSPRAVIEHKARLKLVRGFENCFSSLFQDRVAIAALDHDQDRPDLRELGRELGCDG